MSEAARMSEEEKVEKRTVRPVLIVSDHTIREYSMLLQHLLSGLTDESAPAALVCRPDCKVDSVLLPLVEVVRHPVYDLPFLGRQNLRMLAERLEKFQPTVLHCLCESQAVLTRQLAEQLDLPYVLTVNSLPKRRSKLFILWGRCWRIMAPVGSIAAELRRLYPRFADRIVQVNVGTFVEDSSGCFWEPGGLVSIVTARALNSAHDFESLFKAVKRLVLDGYEFLLVVMGDGPAESQVRKMLRSLGLLWIVTLVPMMEPWRAVLAAGDIYVQPQPSRAFDPLLLEAMSVGTAVAACRGGVDDLIIDGQTGVVFDPNDELSIYASLQRLFERPEFARQLARGAQQYVRENHSVSKMVSDILQVYHDAHLWYAEQGRIQPAEAV
ncbi:MAG TPA: glycosyltransferase family 4 protein [Sedimentisphaerales bacterium]|nr:glycosyltransferase family 4 protein [Sedimentisphaerales bacterium]